jgi:hypothetical protein
MRDFLSLFVVEGGPTWPPSPEWKNKKTRLIGFL